MDNLHNKKVNQKYKHTFTQFSKIVQYSLGPKQKIKYGRYDFETYLKIDKRMIRDIKCLGICLVFDWPKGLKVKDLKIETKFNFKILAKNGGYFEREVEMDITSYYMSTGFGNFLPLCELNGDYFLENDQLTVEVEGIIESPNTIEHTKSIIVRIPFVSKMKDKHSSILFKHDLGLQWRIHTEYYENDRPGYGVFLEAVGPNFTWSCDAHTRLSILKNFKESGFHRAKGLKLTNNCRILPIGQYNKDEVLDPSNGFVDDFDTLSFQFHLHIYHIHGLHPEYDDGIRGITPIVMNQLPYVGHELKSNLLFEIKIPKLTEFKTVVYSVLDCAQNLFWVAFLKVEKVKINNQLETEALGVYIHCFDPNGLTNWSCFSDVKIILKASKTHNDLDRKAKHLFTHKENTFGFNNIMLMKEIMCSERKYLQNNGITVVFQIECKPRQEIDESITSINIPSIIDTRATIKMIVKDFSKFSDVQVTPDWVNIGSTAFKIMVMTHHKLFHNTVVDKVLAFYIKCDSTRKSKEWRCNTQVALKMKCYLPDMTDLVLKFEHQFTKDVVCFGFEEFLLVSVILNPAHGFICNDSIELEAVIEITNEILDDNELLNNNNVKACVDEMKNGILWFDEQVNALHPIVEEVINKGEIINDWNEDQSGVSDELSDSSIPDLPAAFITEENDPGKSAAVKDFIDEQAQIKVEVSAPENSKEEFPKPNELVVIIKNETVDDSYSYENSIDCNQDAIVDNFKIEDEEKHFEIDDPYHSEHKPDIELKNEVINAEMNVTDTNDEQLVANVNYNEEEKLEALKEEGVRDCDNNEVEEAVNVSKMEDHSDHVDNKDVCSLPKDEERLYVKVEFEKEEMLEVLKAEQHSEDEDLKEEKHSLTERDCKDKIAIEVFPQVAVIVSKEEDNPSNFVDDFNSNLVLENMTISDENPDHPEDEPNHEFKKEAINADVNVTITNDEQLAANVNYNVEEKLDALKEEGVRDCDNNEVEEAVNVSKMEDHSDHVDNKDVCSLPKDEERLVVKVEFEKEEMLEVLKAEQHSEDEDLKEEKHSLTERDCKDKIAIEVFPQVAVIVSKEEDNPSNFVDDFNSNLVQENMTISYENPDHPEDKANHEFKKEAINAEVNVTITNDEHLQVNENCKEEEEEKDCDDMKVVKVNSKEAVYVSNDVISLVLDYLSGKIELVPKDDVPCLNCNGGIKQKEIKVRDEKSVKIEDINNSGNKSHHSDQTETYDESNVTTKDESTCSEESATASMEEEPATASMEEKPATVSNEEVTATASMEGEPATASMEGEPATASMEEEPATGHFDNMDLLSPPVKDLFFKIELDSKNELSCINKSTENREENVSCPKKNNNLKDLKIPIIIIDKFEDYLQPEENKAICSLSVENVKQPAVIDNSDVNCSDDDIPGKLVEGQ